MISKDKICAMFAEISPTYDKVNTIVSLGLDSLWRKKLIDQILDSKSITALDLCTGTGALAFLLASKGYKVNATDICEEMMREGMGKIKPTDSIKFSIADAMSLPFADEKFNLITNAFSLRNLPDRQKVFQETFRVLKPNGQALFLDLTTPSSFLRHFHQIYLTYIMPKIGGLISGHKEAYEYLSKSILAFPEPKEIQNLLYSCGFKTVKVTPLSGGIATLWNSKK